MTRTVPTPPVHVSIGAIRDRLGRAHYERLRLGVLPDLGRLPTWAQLPEGAREVHRRRTEWLIDAVAELLVYGGEPRAVIPAPRTAERLCCATLTGQPHKGLCSEGSR